MKSILATVIAFLASALFLPEQIENVAAYVLSQADKGW